MIVRFDNTNQGNEIVVTNNPFLFINKVVFHSNDSTWVNRLFSASLRIRFTFFDKNNTPVLTSEEPIILGAFITPYHRQPVMEISRLYSGNSQERQTPSVNHERCECTISLNNLTLNQGESIEIITEQKELISVDEIVNEIEMRKRIFNDMNFSTSTLLRMLPNFRLDWSQEDEFNESFNIGVTKPILLTGLANDEHKIKTKQLFFEDNEITKLLVNTFLVEKKLSIDLLR